jgi:APA family basic amino acid/polyamine antiporter
MGAIHSRFRTPHIAIALQAVWSCALLATGTYRELFSRVIYTEWIFFAVMTAGLMRMHGRSGYAPAFRAWGYPVVPLLFMAASLGAVWYQIAADPWRAAGGLLLVVLGLPVYCLWVRKSAR